MLRIDVGVHTTITIDLTDVDFAGIASAVFTIKNKPLRSSPVIVTRTFSSGVNTQITITPEESLQLTDGAVYDIDEITTDGKRYKLTENGKIMLRQGVGSAND